jgi:ATP-dependent helicase HepA
MKPVVGQRWISQPEAHLGLGIIEAVEGRLVTVSYPAAQESRTYALENLPLLRVQHQVGETITTMDDVTLTVTAVNAHKSLLFYTGISSDGSERTINEIELDCFGHFTTPQQRLLSGQADKKTAYILKVETLFLLHGLQQNRVKGLLGSRTSLLPHQVFIANEVASRHAPRVLLADEVGLGKTIEAGMILHQQLFTGRAARVLVVVPETLVNQWWIEMLRRFNLKFTIFGLEQVDGLTEEETNPFINEPLVLIGLNHLTDNAVAIAMSLQAEWDMLVVDEAHHLHWHNGKPSNDYTVIENLAQRAKGVLLLTATPEQAGLESHFARLRLLDPARFHDINAFREEHAQYAALNTLLDNVQAQNFDADVKKQLQVYLGDDAAPLMAQKDTAGIVTRLIDRHGTSRVLFRNTRAAIKGFPKRIVHDYPLAAPAEYSDRYGLRQLQPERQIGSDEWLKFDARVAWLKQLIKSIRPHKALIICASAQTAIELELHLRLYGGTTTTVFHEGMSLLERDRAAAYFADFDDGAQCLVCSEIGSEGRNFQFARHLVLMDLPLNPDLLEQRIGRLDRIGQKHDIEIHIPYLQDTAQDVLFQWYQDGLNQFAESFSGGFAVYEQFEQRLHEQLQGPTGDLKKLLADAREVVKTTRIALEKGRDKLLELNSCNPDVAAQLIGEIQRTEDIDALQGYMEKVYDVFGVDHDHHSEHTEILMPSEHMQEGDFPYMPEDGCTVTYSRDRALARDDIEFLSWEHPMVYDSMELIEANERGNACLSTISIKGIKAGTLLIEAVFAIHCAASKSLQLERYLPLSPQRVLIDASGKDLSAVINFDQLNKISQEVPKLKLPAVIQSIRDEISNMVDKVKAMCEPRLAGLTQAATHKLLQDANNEIERLTALAQHNPNIRSEEIDAWRNKAAEGVAAIGRAQLELAAIRVIINT